MVDAEPEGLVDLDAVSDRYRVPLLLAGWCCVPPLGDLPQPFDMGEPPGEGEFTRGLPGR